MNAQELQKISEQLIAPYEGPEQRSPAFYRPYEEASVSTLGAFLGGVRQGFFDSFTGIALDMVQRYKESTAAFASSEPLSVEQIKESYGIDVPDPVSKEYMDALTNRKAEQISIQKALDVYKSETGGLAPVFGFFAGLLVDPLLLGTAGVSYALMNKSAPAVNAVNKFAKLNLSKEGFMKASIPVFEGIVSATHGYGLEAREVYSSDKKGVDPDTVIGYGLFGGAIGTLVAGYAAKGLRSQAKRVASKIDYTKEAVKTPPLKLLEAPKTPLALPKANKYVNNLMDQTVNNLNRVITQPENLLYRNQLYDSLNQYQAFKKLMDFKFIRANKRGLETFVGMKDYFKNWTSETLPEDFFSFVKFPKNLNRDNIASFAKENYNQIKKDFDILSEYMKLPEMQKAVDDIRFYFPKIESFENVFNKVNHLPDYAVERFKEIYDFNRSYYNSGMIQAKGKRLTYFDTFVSGELPDVFDHLPKLKYGEVMNKFDETKFFLDSYSGRYTGVKNLRDLSADEVFERAAFLKNTGNDLFEQLSKESLTTKEFYSAVESFEEAFGKKYFFSPEGLMDFADDVQFFKAIYKDKSSRSLISSQKIRDMFYMNRDIMYEHDMFSNRFFQFLDDKLPRFEQWMATKVKEDPRRFKKFLRSGEFDYAAIDTLSPEELLEVFGTDLESIRQSFTRQPIELPSIKEALAKDFKDTLLPEKVIQFRGRDEIKSLEDVAKVLGYKKAE